MYQLPYWNSYKESSQFNSEGTKSKYIRSLNKFSGWIEMNTDAIELALDSRKKMKISLDKTTQYINWLKEKKLSFSYINLHISAIKHYIEYVRTHKRIQFFNSNDLKLIKFTHVSKNKHLPEEYILKFYDALEQFEPDIQFAFTALISTGIRVDHLKMIDWNEFLYSDTVVLRLGKGNKDRNIYSNPKLLSKLPYGANWALSQQKVSSKLKQMKEIIGYKGQLTPHTLRYTFANRLYRKGAKVETIMILMGHSTMEQTMRYIGIDEVHCKISNSLQFLPQDKAIEYKAVLAENDVLRQTNIEQAMLIQELKGK